MLNKIVKYSLENRLLVMLIAVGLVIFGLYTSKDMDIDVFPDLTAPSVAVITEAHGVATEEVENLVTYPIETALNGAANVRRVRSVTQAGISIVWVDFDWGMDIYLARQIVSEKLVTIKDALPKTADDPMLAPQSSIMGEIMLIAITSDSIPMMELRTLSDWQIRQQLLAVNGVSQVITIGGDYKQYQILLNPQKMRYFGISLDEVNSVCENANVNSSGGVLNNYGQEYMIRAVGRTSEISDIAKMVIKVVDEKPILISDIAEVKIAPKEPKIGDGFLNNKRAVIMTIMKQPHTNTIKLTDRIDNTLAEISKTLPEGVNVNSHIFRQADFIQTSVNNVGKALFEGSIFVVIILFIFLMNYRTTVISLVAIPLSLLVAILILKAFGLSINTMSLGGMAIAIGDLVDDAVIDVENVLKRLKENHRLEKSKRQNTIKVIYDASVEIRSSIIHATLIIMVAFVPLFFLTGMEGRLLRPLGITFIVSLFASLIVALSVTPVMCSFMLTTDKQLNRPIHGGNKLVGKLNKWYGRSLKKLMNHRKMVIASVFGIFILSMIIFAGFGRSFLPEFNEGTLTITTQTMPGISLDESSNITSLVDQALMEIPEIDNVTRRIGRSERSEHMHGGSNSSEIDAPFTITDRSMEEFMQDVRSRLGTISGLSITLGQPLSHRIDHMLSGTRANIAIKVFGTNLTDMYNIAQQISGIATQVEGLVDVNVEQITEVPQIQIKPKRDMLAKYGIAINEFTEFVDIAFAGEVVSEVFEGEKRFELLLRYDEKHRNSMENLKAALIDTPSGDKIPLSFVADIISTSGPNTINRENVHRKIVVSANVAGRDLRSTVNDLRSKVDDQITLEEGYMIEYGGRFESEEKASSMILYTSLIAIFVIFLMLYQEFKDGVTAGIIMLNLPLALIGGVFSIMITSGELSTPALIGFITLFGIATRNGILLVSRYNGLLREGATLKDAILKGSTDRLNPILMTALTAALALIPLALGGDKPGNEIQSPMAKVILGGLLSSTLLNLYIIPSVFYMINLRKEKKQTAIAN